MPSNTDMIGPYQLLESLGQGGMGVVFRAQNQDSGEIVALKTIKATREMELDSIRREIRALARIRHPGIVKIVAEGTEDGLPWYAMEFLQGMTVRQYFSQQAVSRTSGGDDPTQTKSIGWWTNSLNRLPDSDNTLPVLGSYSGGDEQDGGSSRAVTLSKRGAFARVLPLIQKLCSPLAFLHGEGIVHRDLKPENIMVRNDGAPVLVDFGLMTQFTAEESRETLTVEQEVMGTVSYMAPEQIRGEFVDARADLYALGCILYELLVGHPPYIGLLPAHILQAHLYGTPTPPSRLRPEVQPELDTLICRLLTKDPRDRIGHSDAVAKALGDLCGEHLVEPGPKPKSYLYRSRCAGREAALEKLRLGSRHLKRGKGGLLLVGGESGLGKTRLVMEFSRELATDSVLVLAGECSEGRAKSLEAFLKPLQYIADRCREHGLAETEKLLGRKGKVFARFEPSLSNLPGQAAYTEPTELPPDAARLRLFNYLSATFREIASQTPVALLLDDLHWADDLVLGFLEYVLRTGHLENSALLIIGTYRIEAVVTELQAIIENSDVENIHLDRLGEDSVAEIVSDMLALSPPPGIFSRYLSSRAAGNPLFVSEYLRVSIDSGLLYRDEQGSWTLPGNLQDEKPENMAVYEKLPLPTSLRGLIERRLSGLSAEDRVLLEAAAIVGQEVNINLIGHMTNQEKPETHDALNSLLKFHVLEKSTSDTVRFSHAQIRDVSLAQLDKGRKKELHRQAAEGIQIVYAAQLDQYQAELGLHWETAGEADKARPCYLAAARGSRDRDDYHDAERLYGAYLNLVSTQDAEALAARCERGDVFLDTGHYDAARNDFQAVLDKTRDDQMRAACMRKNATILQMQGEVESARQVLLEALNLAEEYPLERARILNNWANDEIQFQSNYEEAEHICEKAYQAITTLCPMLENSFETFIHEKPRLHLAQELHIVLAHTLSNIGLVFRQRRQLDRALETFRRLEAIFEEIGDKRGLGTALNNVANVYTDRGEFDRALEVLRKLVDLFEEIGDRQRLGTVSGNMGIIFFSQSDFDHALTYQQKALSIFEEIGDKRGIARALSSSGLVHYYRDDYDKALACQHRALTIYEHIQDKRGFISTAGNIGLAYFYKGEYDRALEYHLKALAFSEEIHDTMGSAIALRCIGEIYQLSGDLEKALECHEKARDLFEELGDRKSVASAWRFIGQIYCCRDDQDVAIQSLVKARDISKEINDSIGEAEVLVDLSETYRFLNDLERASKLNLDAMTLFKESANELGVGDCWCCRVEIELDWGDRAAAKQACSKTQEIYQQYKNGLYSWRLPLIQIRLAIEEMRAESKDACSSTNNLTVEQARQFVDQVQDNPRIQLKIESLYLLGLACQAQSQNTLARTSFEKALTLAKKYGFRLLEHQIEKELSTS